MRLEEEIRSDVFEPLAFHYMEISSLLLKHAAEDIEQVEHIRSLLEDLQNVRQDKIRSGLCKISNDVQSGGTAYAIQMNNIAALEINSVRRLMTNSLQLFHKMKQLGASDGTEQEETQSSQLPFSNSSLGTLIFSVHFHSLCVLYHALETPPSTPVWCVKQWQSTLSHRMQSDNLWRDRNKVFVAGLPRDVDDDALYNKFRAFGDMFQAKVVYDAATGRSKGFGFLTYRQYDHAMDAIDKTNGKNWNGRVLNVRFLKPKTGSEKDIKSTDAPELMPLKINTSMKNCTTLYVGNLSYEITEDIVRRVFSPFGDIKAVRLAQHIQTKKFRGFGYVQFYDSESCTKALAANGKIVIGRPMHVDLSGEDDGLIKQKREEMEKKLKKGICHRFQSNKCVHGDACKFAHVQKNQENHSTANVKANSEQESTATAYHTSAVKSSEAGSTVCINYQKGKCNRGNNCRYLHLSQKDPSTSTNDMRQIKGIIDETSDGSDTSTSSSPRTESVSENAESKEATTLDTSTPLCQNFQKGKCKRGSNCRFRHSDTASVSEGGSTKPIQQPHDMKESSKTLKKSSRHDSLTIDESSTHEDKRKKKKRKSGESDENAIQSQ
ncbi:unnamed protein product [Albugo candida]|nr:unnamed protein product [Albugo candida]|eukprot:CCI46922.1 unnamed protein product [Albugo candida]